MTGLQVCVCVCLCLPVYLSSGAASSKELWLEDTALGGEGDFTGNFRLPLPETFSGNPANWEEWAWNFQAYVSMFETGAVTLLC